MPARIATSNRRPRNDRLAYISSGEVASFLDEIARDRLPVELIGFTGGEPFMNRDLIAMLADAMSRGFRALVLTNAMRPMQRFRPDLLALNERFTGRLTIRVSIDHYTKALHGLERGPRSRQPTIDGLLWLARHGFRLNVAGRLYSGEAEGVVRAGYARLFASLGVLLDAFDPVDLVLFPEMDARVDVPEITEACWGIIGKSPEDVMCASSRMVVKPKGAERPAVLACTLLAYDEAFELGTTLAEASRPVALNHPHCAKCCVLGGAVCGAAGREGAPAPPSPRDGSHEAKRGKGPKAPAEMQPASASPVANPASVSPSAVIPLARSQRAGPS